MGKREKEKKERLSRDFYPTIDPEAALALKPFLWRPAGPTRYVEPCAGDGSLIRLLASVAAPCEAVEAYDIDPQGPGIVKRDCLTLTDRLSQRGRHCFITNPPFKWSLLQPILEHLPTLGDTWLLLPADVMHNKRVAPYILNCSDIVSVGRLYWFKNEEGKYVRGVDNYAWFKFRSKFGAESYQQYTTKFHGRQV